MVIPQCALVRAAIVHVRKQYRGASLVQIRKHLEATYEEVFDATKKKLIHSTFRNLVQEGTFLRTGTIYRSAQKHIIVPADESTKKPAIIEADVPQRHHRRHLRRQYHSGRRHRRRRHRRRRRHSRRRHQRRRRHGKRHHGRRHHRRRHRSRGHHRRSHHRRSHHGRRHHRIKVHRSNKRIYTHIHHGQGVSGNPSVDVPVDKLSLTPTVPKVLEQKK